MILFDINKLSVSHVYLKSVTTGSGGRISIVDEDLSTENNEVLKHLKSDWAIVRRFQKVNDASRFLNPVLCAVAHYDGKMIALEMHPLGAMGEDDIELGGVITKWKSSIEDNVKVLRDSTVHGDWWVDGFAVYQLTGGEEISLSKDGRFSSVPAMVFKLIEMDNGTFSLPESRVCLKYRTKGNVMDRSAMAISPPIWKNLTSLGMKELKKSATDEGVAFKDSGRNKFQFDKVDNHLAVNVDFALKAARELSEVFGYEVIEPLGLADLMIELGTVNLPSVDKSVRQTFEIGLKFTHAASWLIGLLHQTDTLDAYMAVRSVLKYLSAHGVYRKQAFNESSVYKSGQNHQSIPLMSIDGAVESYESRVSDMTFGDWMKLVSLEEKRGRGGRINNVAGLVNADDD